MLVGRSLEIDGNIYSRLMVETQFLSTEPGLQACIFLINKWVIDNNNYISTLTQKMISIHNGKIINY